MNAISCVFKDCAHFLYKINVYSIFAKIVHYFALKKSVNSSFAKIISVHGTYSKSVKKM